jgi:ribose transport system ATP-binding protein
MRPTGPQADEGPPREAAVPRLDVRHVSKTFGRRTVLSDLNLTVLPGEIHGIVGQNGSGKSTFAKAVSGYHAPDPGAEIFVDGQPLSLPVSPGELRRHGVSIVHQHLGLIEDVSVAENVRIAVMQAGRWSRRIDWRHETAQATAALERLGYTRSMRTPVADLSLAERACVAIARAIQVQPHGGGLVIFDESTRALPAEALDEFYATVAGLVDSGTGVLMIGHRLGEMLEHCDRITVLRDGRVAAGGLETQGLSESDLATHMLGHGLQHLDLPASDRRRAGQPVTISGLHGAGLADDLDLRIEPGEIVGLTGLPDAGFEAVPYLICGAEPARGTLQLGDRQLDLARTSVAQLVREGVVLVPADRPGSGLGLEHSVLENVTLPWLSQRGRPWSTGGRWQREEAEHVIATLGVVPADPRQVVGRLSGGNAQKVLLGKWMIGDPKLLVLHEPTQGVDVKARVDLLGAVHRLAAAGTTVLVATTEPEDLVTICDRILFFRQGRVSDALAYPFGIDQIVNTIYSAEAKQAGRRPRAAVSHD